MTMSITQTYRVNVINNIILTNAEKKKSIKRKDRSPFVRMSRVMLQEHIIIDFMSYEGYSAIKHHISTMIK